jgi:hypothetical protein
VRRRQCYPIRRKKDGKLKMTIKTILEFAQLREEFGEEMCSIGGAALWF